MNGEKLRIEKFRNVSYVKDKKGRVLSFRSRYASCFILPIKGTIRFTFPDQTVTTTPSQGIFIPEGASYTNECLESAESISVNFYLTDPPKGACALRGMNETAAMALYHEMHQKACENTESANYYLLSKLYELAYLLLPADPPKSPKELIVEKALSYMQSEASRADLQIDEVASFCNVSAVYLRKIAKEIFQKSPYRLLTEMRMKKAREMLLEKRSVKEVAVSVGYSDVFQFSRAYKRHFGHAPTLGT